MTTPVTPAGVPALGAASAPDEETRRCSECQTVLAAGASVCTTCKAHQDRRRYLVLAGMIIPVLVGLGTVVRNFADVVDWFRDLRGGINVVVAKPACSASEVVLTLVNEGKSQVLVENLQMAVLDDGVARQHDMKLVADKTVVKGSDSTTMTIKANVDGIPIIFPSRRTTRCAFDINFLLVSKDKRVPQTVRCDCT